MIIGNLIKVDVFPLKSFVSTRSLTVQNNGRFQNPRIARFIFYLNEYGFITIQLLQRRCFACFKCFKVLERLSWYDAERKSQALTLRNLKANSEIKSNVGIIRVRRAAVDGDRDGIEPPR